jgi:Transcriptional regulator, AbiEi antitoxin
MGAPTARVRRGRRAARSRRVRSSAPPRGAAAADGGHKGVSWSALLTLPRIGVNVDSVEQKLAGLARRSHGVVTRREVLGSGISAKEIERRLLTGALIAVCRGVYRVGHTAPSLEAHYLAAVKACGHEALVSGRAAAHL